MYQAQQALISHLQSADIAADETAQTIKEYAGEVQKGITGRIDLPAILVLYSTGNPMARLPDLEFELLLIASNDYAKKEKGKSNALKFAQAYAEFCRDNKEFEDEHSYYLLSGQGSQKLEDQQIETILNDFKYTILSLPVTVKVDRND
jgi:hypothetical protein